MIRTKDAISVELGQRLQASPKHCDETTPKEASPKETAPKEKSAPVRVNSSPRVLPCLAFAAKHNIVTSKHLVVIQSIHKQVDNTAFSALSAMLAVLSLECENVRSMAAGTPFASLLEVVLVCSFVVFGVELLVRCAAEEDYCCSAWFPLDLLATLTLLMELHCFQDLAFNDDCHMISSSSDHYAHVGGQAAHALRVARVLRILRLARLIKLYRLCFGLAVCSETWFPWMALNFWSLLGKIVSVPDSVATKSPGAEDDWFQGVFEV